MNVAPTRVRIGFDAGALAFAAGGVRRYARELFSRLPAIAPDIDFVAVGLPDGIDAPAGTVSGARVAALPTNLARMAIAVPLAIRASRLHLFHAPAYTAPLSSPCPVVLTIHDVSYARRPEFYPHASGPLRQWFYRRSALGAARIITDSVFSGREIASAYAVPEARVAVIPLGVDEAFGPAGEALTPQAGPGLPAGVRPPYALHVGELHPRRDLLTALRSVLEVRRRGAGAESLQLVCAGVDRGVAERLRRESAEAGAPEAVVLPGAVPEDELLALYRHAVALVYPSMYEGFGLPVLEAMACGLPVIAARAGSVPEVVGDAAILVECGDWRSIADALGRLLVGGHAAVLRDRGLQRAREFSWARTARSTLDVYRALLGDTGTRGQ